MWLSIARNAVKVFTRRFVYVRCFTMCVVLLQLVVIFFALVAFAHAQFGGFGFDSSSFDGGFGGQLTNARDPRANTGPVVFPPAPPDSGETSGVVVGASGYGFVPPQSPSKIHA